MSETLFRFVIDRRHPRSGKRTGLFHALDELRDDDDTPAHVREAIKALTAWFNKELPAPYRDWTNKNEREGRIDHGERSISWLKASAHEHIAKLRELAVMLGEAGWAVEELRTTRPGKVLYEDEYQIVAEPFADTPT